MINIELNSKIESSSNSLDSLEMIIQPNGNSVSNLNIEKSSENCILENNSINFSFSHDPDFSPRTSSLNTNNEQKALDDALADIDSIASKLHDYDVEEPPEQSAIDNARDLLQKIFRIYPVKYFISPTERCGVAISPPIRKGGAVSFECAPSGVVHCFASIDGNRRRAKYFQTDDLPDPFMEKALKDLAKK